MVMNNSNTNFLWVITKDDNWFRQISQIILLSDKVFRLLVEENEIPVYSPIIK